MMDCVGTAGVGAGDDAAVLVRGDVRAGEVTSAAFWLSAPLPDRLATTRLVANAVIVTSAMPTAISFQGLFQPPLLMIRFLLCARNVPVGTGGKWQFGCQANQGLDRRISDKRGAGNGKNFPSRVTMTGKIQRMVRLARRRRSDRRASPPPWPSAAALGASTILPPGRGRPRREGEPRPPPR